MAITPKRKKIARKGRINKYLIVLVFVFLGVFIIIIMSILKSIKQPIQSSDIPTINQKTILLASGEVRSKNEVSLHFQIAGKLIYLPFQPGDKVRSGQIIASLDTYTLQRQLTIALNAYKITRDNFDQTQENYDDNVLKTMQIYPYDYYSKAYIGGSYEDDVINDALLRILDQSQMNLNSSVAQVEIASYALSLSSLTSPINGILLQEDTTTKGVNISPTNSFIIADPEKMVFRANISESEIALISEGNKSTINLTGLRSQSIKGTVTKIYPNKITLPTGENVYQADIESLDLQEYAKLLQDGVAEISLSSQAITAIPSWIILNNKYTWVEEEGKAMLKEIETGSSINGFTPVFKGLLPEDKLITNPQDIVRNKYILY
jgi:multidrug efflux pump subunit AcrA (membrane-fusion protein)